MRTLADLSRTLRESPRLVFDAIRTASAREVMVAVVATVIVGLLIGFATVLIPNDVFTREIAPTRWNYPMWVLTAVLSGLLAATYVRRTPIRDTPVPANTAGDAADADIASAPTGDADMDRRSTRVGLVGTFVAWFAVGCPVCNKIAVLALGYTGALTWFAPLQPILAVVALFLLWTALAWRLRGRIACRIPSRVTVPS